MTDENRMGKTCYQADDHRWGKGKIRLMTEDGLSTRCGRALAVIPGRLVEAGSYSCKACRAAKERGQAPRPVAPPRPTNYENNGPAGAASFEMPFGRHRGTPVYDLDDGYLKWLRDKVNLFGGLRAAVTEELESRGFAGIDEEDD
jgi:uncharacterized protein (DUF3820 family)